MGPFAVRFVFFLTSVQSYLAVFLHITTNRLINIEYNYVILSDEFTMQYPRKNITKNILHGTHSYIFTNES